MSATTNGMTTPKHFSIAVAGGGIGGVCLAIALHDHKIPVHIYEAAHAFTEVGAGIGFGTNSLRAMAMLDPALLKAYKHCETTNGWPSKRQVVFDFRYGMAKASSEGYKPAQSLMELSSETGMSSVHRARFLEEMVKLVPEGMASFGKRVEDIEEVDDGVVLKFADGTTAKHNAVVGCDGIKSRVRKVLLGEHNRESEAIFSGSYCYRGLVPMEKAKELVGEECAENTQMYFGKHGHVLTMPIEHNTIMNVAAAHSKDDGWDDPKWVKHVTRADMVADFDGWNDNVMKILTLMDDPDIWALFDSPPASTYHRKGKICLLGDAAHASTPHHGAGAGMAVEDALILSRLLAQISEPEDLESVFAAYDDIRRPRTQRLVTSSRRNGQVLDLEDKELGENIDDIRDHLSHAWDWIWNEDLDRQLAAAQSKFDERRKVPMMNGHSV